MPAFAKKRCSGSRRPSGYSIWKDIADRVAKKNINGHENRAAFARRLRLTALRTPKAEIAKAMKDMPGRIARVVEKKREALPADERRERLSPAEKKQLRRQLWGGLRRDLARTQAVAPLSLRKRSACAPHFGRPQGGN